MPTRSEGIAPSFDTERVPLSGRESEFDHVLHFLDARHRQEHHRVLFVCGACGSGKTSTVLRALRAVHHKPLPCDDKTTLVSVGTAAARKRPREIAMDTDGEKTGGGCRRAGRRSGSLGPNASGKGMDDSSPSSAGGGMCSQRSSGGDSATAAPWVPLFQQDDAEDARDGEPPSGCLARRYHRLFSHLNTPRLAAGRGPVQAHYVNCADLTPQQLADSLVRSMKSIYRRPDAAVRQLMETLCDIAKQCSNRTGRKRSSQKAVITPAMNSRTASRTRSPPPTMQVFVLDEVEYVRPAARAVLTELAALSFHLPTELALIFISNHRDLVHVPPMLMEELPFEAYSVDALTRIGSQAAQAQLQLLAEGHSEVGTLAISPRLYEYIARKAVLEHSGDVRQVLAMCHRVVYAAHQEWQWREPIASPAAAKDDNATNKLEEGPAVTQNQTLNATLAAAVNALPATTATGSCGRCSTLSSSSEAADGSTPTRSSAAARGAEPFSGASRSSTVLSLAASVKVLRAGAMEDKLTKHLAAMPEHMLYVLSCLIAQSLQLERDRQKSTVGIAGMPSATRGTAGTAGTPARANGSRTRRVEGTAVTRGQVLNLYTRLVGRHHFPAMNASGVASAIDGLADQAIITRPQARGSDVVFSFNGTWSLEAMQTALIDRGEAIRQEMENCGLDGSENRFVTVFRELQTMTGLTY